MEKYRNSKIPVFMLNIPLLDNEFDPNPEETFVFIMGQADFNDAEYKNATLN
jgi:hypothetical protein